MLFTVIAAFTFSLTSFANSSKDNGVESLSMHIKNTTTIGNPKIEITLDCSGFAYHMTAAVEELNGCMSGSDYNDSMAYWTAMCVIMTP